MHKGLFQATSGANPNKCYIPFQLSVLSELISLIETQNGLVNYLRTNKRLGKSILEEFRGGKAGNARLHKSCVRPRVHVICFSNGH
jgi:hypothetical protein